MLSSGRLGKGSFQEVTDEMNKRCNMQEGFEIGNLAPPSGNLYAAYHMLHIICMIENFKKDNNLYEREQLAAKLQNLKTQFRNRKIAVDEGKLLTV